MMRSWFAGVLLVALAACGSKKTDDATQTRPAADGSAGSGSVDGAPKRSPVTAKKLAPIIKELGVDKVVPTAIVIELATPIVERDAVGQTSADSVLAISPAVAGTLTTTGVSELTFTPNGPLEFDTTYTVELKKLATSDGVMEPAPGEKWTYAFKTPAFAFLGWAPTDIDLSKHKVTMDIAFSGAVLPNIARQAMTFTLDGKATSAVSVLPSREPNVVKVQLTDPRIALGTKLGLAIKKDLKAVRDTKGAAGATAELVISADKAISVKTAAVVEGSNGFYLEVICDDKAAAPGERSYYEDEGYYNLSQRCQLSDDALNHVHFDPPVKKTYITAGRAGFRVFGDFKRGAYKLRIDAGATSVDGGVLLAPFARSFAVSGRKPQLSFAASGRYLPKSAWTNLGIKFLNVEEINLVVRQVPPENLIFWLGNSSDAADERTSNVILKKTIPLRGDADVATTTWLDVASLLPATTKGVLELKVIGVGSSASSRLLLTDMSLVAKKTSPPDKPWAQTVQVWALGMDSAELLGGVDVSLVRKSGKVVGKCTTSGDKGCTVTVKTDDDPDQAEPFAVVARKGDDLTYIRYQDLKAAVTDASTSGAPYVADSPYRAAMFSDRGVYRPGDTAHVVAIVRDAKDHAPDAALPVEVKVIDPRAKVVRKMMMKPNAGGVIAFDHALPAFADTGHWRVALSVADKGLASYDLQVEEFVPERMKVTATPKQPSVLIGTPVAFDVSAQYLFGGSAIDSGVELTCAVTPARFEPKENADLTYGVEPKGKAVNLGEAREQLDPKGTVTIACPELENTSFTQTGRLDATVAVLEAGSGRATVRTASAMLHPEKYYLGLRTKATKAASGETFTVEGTVVDWTGKVLPAATTGVHVELVHLEADYGYGFDDATGESRYDRWLRTVPEGKQEAKVSGGKFTFDVTPGQASAGYVVRVKSGKAKTELVLDGEYPYEDYGYGDDSHADQTPRPAKPTQLAIDVAKDVRVGAPVAVKVKSPYKGKVLWTVETDHVITAEWKDVTPGEATWSFTLAAYAPNVYVSALIIKDPHVESKDAFLPDRAFGVSSARVAPVEFTQAVTIEAPKEIRSNAPLTVKLDVGAGAGPTFATVAVVDEGILSLTSFPTPDPLAQLFAKRALGVETYETIGWTMLHQPAGASSKTGGGDDYMGQEGGGKLDKGRVQPVKPVALFSGIVQVGPDGKATIPFQIPTYRGQLRVMAITSSASKIGRAEAKVTVRDPLVVQVTFPRFVTQHDELQIPVFLTNMSGGPLTVTVKLDSASLAIAGLVQPKGGPAPLSFAGKDTGTVKIENGHAETVVFAAKAMLPVGGAKLRVVATAGALHFEDTVDVPFLPAGPKDRTIQKLKVDAGTLDLAKVPALKNWVPTSETTTFWLTSNPYGESFEHLSYLIHYPYGCIEQTTSSTRPLLYVANLAEQVDPQLAELKIEDMVLSGINRVFSMETPSGGFGYWPGATEPLEWATAYATHMLLDAKKAGYAVPDDRLAGVLTWIDGRVGQYERGDKIARQPWNHYDEQAEAYLHYVLARAGKGKKARILKLIAGYGAKVSGEQAEDLYLLKAALYLAGDRRYEKDLKAVDASPIAAERINSWSFYSDRRRRGMMLSTFHDLFGNDPAGEVLAQRVAEGLTGQASGYYNTQELVWGVTGLGKWVTSMASKAVAGGKLVADGATIEPRKTRAKSNDKAWSVMRASEYKSLTLEIPAQAAGLWLVVNSEGVRPGNDYKVGGNGLAITRSYHTLDGTSIDLSKGTLQLGDLIFVELVIENTSGAVIQNIALVDRLPAGFEVENPRLGRSTKADWIKDDEQWPLDFMNLRDDRLEAFGQLGPSQSKKIVYTVRAVTSGTFTVPPVEAEAMYDPTLWAREKGTTAVIGGPWTGKTL